MPPYSISDHDCRIVHPIPHGEKASSILKSDTFHTELIFALQGATSRHVYLPPLPAGTVWTNVFTGVITDTSAGGKNISEATPLDSFPLYKRHTNAA